MSPRAGDPYRREQARKTMRNMIVPGGPQIGYGPSDEPPHWRCADCGITCSCTGLARELPHPRCGRAEA